MFAEAFGAFTDGETDKRAQTDLAALTRGRMQAVTFESVSVCSFF